MTESTTTDTQSTTTTDTTTTDSQSTTTTETAITSEYDERAVDALINRCAANPSIPLITELLAGCQLQHLRGRRILRDILDTFRTAYKVMSDCEERSRNRRITGPDKIKDWPIAAVENRYTHGVHFHDTYRTLAMLGSASFLKWRKLNSNGKLSYTLLDDLTFYPALITKSMRMISVRPTKKQITYIRDEMCSFKKIIGKKEFLVRVQFPRENTEQRNIVIRLEQWPGADICYLEFMFDGDQIRLVNMISSDPFYSKGYDAMVKENLINCPEALDNFLWDCLRPFSYNTLRAHCKILDQYLVGNYYKVGLAAAAKTPLFILDEYIGFV